MHTVKPVLRGYHLGHKKNGFIRQVTFLKGSIPMKYSMTGQEGDILIEVTAF